MVELFEDEMLFSVTFFFCLFLLSGITILRVLVQFLKKEGTESITLAKSRIVGIFSLTINMMLIGITVVIEFWHKIPYKVEGNPFLDLVMSLFKAVDKNINMQNLVIIVTTSLSAMFASFYISRYTNKRIEKELERKIKTAKVSIHDLQHTNRGLEFEKIDLLKKGEQLKEELLKVNTNLSSMSDVNASNYAFAVSPIARNNKGKDVSEIVFSQAEERNILVDQTVNKINHLLKSPLSGIHVCLDSLEDKYNDTELHNKLGRIRIHIETIEDNLNALRRDVGAVDNSGEVDLGYEMKKRLENLCLSNSKNIHLNFDCSTQTAVKGRKFKNIMACIYCIIENAVYFSRDNDAIKVVIEEDENITIKIINYGPHISEPDQIFNAGYSTKGTSGIGLSTAKELVERMGGTITGENLYLETPDIGVQFTIILPFFSTKTGKENLEIKNNTNWIDDI